MILLAVAPKDIFIASSSNHNVMMGLLAFPLEDVLFWVLDIIKPIKYTLVLTGQIHISIAVICVPLFAANCIPSI